MPTEPKLLPWETKPCPCGCEKQWRRVPKGHPAYPGIEHKPEDRRHPLPHPSPEAPAEWMRKAAEELSKRTFPHDSQVATREREAAALQVIAKHAPACDADKPAWRTMEDAPRDGTWFLGMRERHERCEYYVMAWSVKSSLWFGYLGTFPPAVTHWQPLPAPPAAMPPAAAKEGE